MSMLTADQPVRRESARTATSVQAGDRVRSFDFPDRDERPLDGPRACYLEGVVEAIGRFSPNGGESCDHYKIRVVRWVFRGEELAEFAPYAYPPVNGVPTWAGRQTDGVVRID